MALKDMISPAGGISYHLIASRRALTLWSSFRAQTRLWILDWFNEFSSLSGSEFSEGELIVFGPSAGWTLPLADFEKVKKLTFVEPDPLARFLLRRRMHRKDLVFVSDRTLLPWLNSNGSADSLIRFLNHNPNAAILFANVLGQLPLLLPKETSPAHYKLSQANFVNALSGRSWASYHDLFSVNSKRDLREKVKLRTLSLKPASDFTALANETFADIEFKVTSDFVVTDHEMKWLSTAHGLPSEKETQIALWPLTNGQIHLIGFVKECAPASRRRDKVSR